MRKFSRALAVVAIVAASVIVVPSTAQAAYTPPVVPLPTLPGQTGAVLGGQGSVAVQTYQLWKALLQYKPPTPTAPVPTAPVVPKPITAPATFARGAAGGPIVGAFFGGFAIGQAGLQLYGTVTGDDPLKNICGSGFEGVGSVIYMGMMPECTAEVLTPNGDKEATFSLSAGGITSSVVGTYTNSVGQQYYCWKPIINAPGGYPYTLQPNGVWSSLNPNVTGVRACENLGAYATSKHDNYRLSNGPPGSSGATTVADAVQTRPDPVRTPSCTIKWQDGSTTQGMGTTYRESQGIPMSSSGLGCEKAYVSKPGAGPDLLPERISVGSSDGISNTTIAEQTVPAFGPDDRIGLSPGNGVGLVLEKVVNGVTDSCNTWAASCVNWWTETQNGTVKETQTGTYRCTFGGAEVGLAQCGPYRHTFDTRTDSPTITDPQTGAQQPWLTNSNQNSTNPGTGPAPGEQCMADWSSAPNPIEWILHPVKCALVWAFAPRPAKVNEFATKMDTNWRGSSVGQLATAVSGVGVAFGGLSEGGCGGVLVGIPVPNSRGEVTTKNERYLAACPGDFFAPHAPVFKVLIGLTIVIIGVFAVRDQLDRFVNNS